MQVIKIGLLTFCTIAMPLMMLGMPDRECHTLIEDLVQSGVTIDNSSALADALTSGRTLVVGTAFDPSSDSLHIGHEVLLSVINKFRRCGHKVVILVNSLVAQTGDPSDYLMSRPIIDKDTILSNRAKCVKQLNVYFQNQLTTINGLTFQTPLNDVLKLGRRVDMSYFISRPDFSKRMANGTLNIVDMNYVVYTAHELSTLPVDVYIYGFDQRHNMALSASMFPDIWKHRYTVMVPLLLGDDGQKMGKSSNNAIYLNQDPSDLYAKVYDISDATRRSWAKQLAARLKDLDIEDHDIEALKQTSKNEEHRHELNQMMARHLQRLLIKPSAG